MGKKTAIKQQRKELLREEMRARGINSGGDLVKDWYKSHLTRRSFGKGVAWSAVLGMAGVTVYQLASGGDNEITLDSLELQQKNGWNVGSLDKPLAFEGSVARDSRNNTWPKVEANTLLPIYQPRAASWQPFFVPTLLQSLNQSSLQSQIRPILTPRMQDTYARAQGFRELLSQTQNAQQTLIIADLPGSESVALGAALADTAELVPVFDNWPHPLGVVKAHETLGAMTYFANEIQEKKSQLKADAPAMLLLDSQRLTPYQDEESQFDNRYLAKVPPPDQLKQRGITNVMYVVRDQSQNNELDDLNEDFVAWQQQGIGVKLMRLSDFSPKDEEVETKNADGTTTRHTERRYYYYGHPHTHWWWYSHYFYQPYSNASYYRGGGYSPLPRTAPPPPNPVSYRPVSRPTIFSAAKVGGNVTGVGKVKPTGFGRTSVRMSSSGQVTGTRSGRSGSYGRGIGGWFGG